MFNQIGVLNIAPVWKPCHKGNLPSNHRVLGASSSFQGESYFLEFNLGQNLFFSHKLKISILIIRTNIAPENGGWETTFLLENPILRCYVSTVGTLFRLVCLYFPAACHGRFDTRSFWDDSAPPNQPALNKFLVTQSSFE